MSTDNRYGHPRGNNPPHGAGFFFYPSANPDEIGRYTQIIRSMRSRADFVQSKAEKPAPKILRRTWKRVVIQESGFCNPARFWKCLEEVIEKTIGGPSPTEKKILDDIGDINHQIYQSKIPFLNYYYQGTEALKPKKECLVEMKNKFKFFNSFALDPQADRYRVKDFYMAKSTSHMNSPKGIFFSEDGS